MCIYCDYCVYHYKSTELVSLYTLDIGLKINIIIITIRSDTEDDEDQHDTFYTSDLLGNVVEDVNDDTNDKKSEYDSNTNETDTDDAIESSDDEQIKEMWKSGRLR